MWLEQITGTNSESDEMNDRGGGGGVNAVNNHFFVDNNDENEDYRHSLWHEIRWRGLIYSSMMYKERERENIYIIR